MITKEITKEITREITREIIIGSAIDPNAFISTWSAIPFAGNTITLPYVGVHDIMINWGDGTIEQSTNLSPNLSHAYASSGLKTISITGTNTEFNFDTGLSDKTTITNIKQWGSLEIGANNQAFNGCVNLDITATDSIKIQPFALSTMFGNCSSLTSTQWLSTFDISDCIFAFLAFSESALDADYSVLDFSNITNAAAMLDGVNLSIANYDATLIGLQAQTLKNNVFFGVDSSKYSIGAASEARRLIGNNNNWTIDDAGADDATFFLDASNNKSLSNPANNDPISGGSGSDLSYAGNNYTQGILANQPVYKTNAINGLPELNMSGLSQYLLANSLAGVTSGDHTIFAVVRSDTITVGSNGHAPIAWNDVGGSNNEVYIITESTGVMDLFNPTGSTIINEDLRNSTDIFTFVCDYGVTQNDITAYRNGVEKLTKTSNNPAVATTFAIGMEYDGVNPSNFFNGGIGEIIVFPRKLSVSEIEFYNNYLSNKWNI